MESSRFLISREGDVTVIRLNDPATMNALTMPMAAELKGHLLAAEQVSGAVILAGGERAFCSGANLGDGLDAAKPGEVDAGADLEERVNPTMMALRDLKIPLVTAVRGVAAGVGASLAMIGDLVVAGRNAYFLQAFSRIGLVPDGGSPWLLAHTVGRIRAMELMLLGEKLPAETAFAWGMVTRLVDDAQVEDEAMRLAQRLVKGPRMALGLIRQAAWAAAESTFEDELLLERDLQREAGYHPDFAEGVAAFTEKRPARFNADRLDVVDSKSVIDHLA